MRYPPDFITQEAHARHGVEFECTHQSGTWLTTRRDILLLLSGCKFLTFTKQQRDSRLFRRIACPKSSTKNRNRNNFCAIFCVEGFLRLNRARRRFFGIWLKGYSAVFGGARPAWLLGAAICRKNHLRRLGRSHRRCEPPKMQRLWR